MFKEHVCLRNTFVYGRFVLNIVVHIILLYVVFKKDFSFGKTCF